MPPPIPVLLADYDPDWPRRAAELSAQLSVLGSVLAGVHHIGSTSVPGLPAKPILDLLPVVKNLADLDRSASRVRELGYEWHGELGIEGRRYCTMTDGRDRRVAQLHFFVEGSPQIHRHVAFRDYLRAHQDVAEAYALEKRRARDLHPNDSHAYTDAKAAWIEVALSAALAWAAEQRPLAGGG